MAAFKKQISWDINSACNYSCSYCSLHGKGALPAPCATLLRTPGEWAERWDRFHERFGRARISIAGGEPFLYPGFLEILAALSRKHEVYVITNFSADLSGLAGLVSPGSVRLVLSLHPEHVPEPEEFLRRASVLKEQGFKVRVTAVAYPPLIGAVLDCGRRCEALGLKFVGTPFFGNYDGRHYPQAYSAAEKNSLKPLLDQPGHALFQFQEVNPLGRPCRAGADYCRISPDGSVKACLNGPPLADFMDPGFEFLAGPAACPSPHCHCMLEFAYCQAGERQQGGSGK